MKRGPRIVLTAALRVQVLTNHFLIGLRIAEALQLEAAARDSFVAARSIGEHADRTNLVAPRVDLAKAYRPTWHFCYELHTDPCFDLKRVARVVGATPVKSGWRRVQQWLRAGKDLPRYAAAVRQLLEVRIPL